MKLEPGFLFDHSFQKLEPILFEKVTPTPIENAKIIHTTHLKTELGLSELTHAENQSEIRIKELYCPVSDQKLKSWLEILYSPFAEHPDFDRYAWPTPAEHKHIEVSCSS